MPASRVLLLRAGALGDILLLRRTLATLKTAGHQVDLLVPRGSGEVLIGSGIAEAGRLIDWGRPELAPLHQRLDAVTEQARAALAAYHVIVAYTRSQTLIANLRTSRPDDPQGLCPRVLAHDPQPPPQGPHAAEWLASAVRELAPRQVPPPPSRPTDDERAAATVWLRQLPTGFLALHPGSGAAAKNWPAARFAEVVAALGADRPWLLVEGPADAAACAPLRALPGVLRPLRLPVRVLAALLHHAGLYVGNDSGVTHLAAAWGAPTLALFGPTDPRLWAPVGPFVRCLRGQGGVIDALAVADVVAAARELAGAPVSSPAPPSG